MFCGGGGGNPLMEDKGEKSGPWAKIAAKNG